MFAPGGPAASLATVATETPDRAQQRAATAVCSAAGLATVFLTPFASYSGLVVPGFTVINQTALLIAYALGAFVLFAQYRRGRALPLLLIASGALYCAAIILLQLLSVPGIVPNGRLLGHGPDTTIWLWTFWHIGPPGFALAYACIRRAGAYRILSERQASVAAGGGAVFALVLAGAAGLLATRGLPYLPLQVVGDDYTALVTSGVAPAVEALTVAAAFVVWRATRQNRTVLELWLLVSLILLILDNVLTMAGAARGTVGWYVGRIEATVSAFAILWAYLHEIDALRLRAEAAAEDVRRTEAALRQAQRLEAVGRLTSGIAHDFNNILTIVSGSLEMLRRHPENRDRVLRAADIGLEAVTRGATLTRQLLTFARRQTLRPETLDVNALLAEFEVLARRAVGEGVELTVTLDPDPALATLDRSEFEAAVLNLVINARDALAAQHGRIAVSTRHESVATAGPAEDVLQGVALPVGDCVVVAVADNGSGMDERTRLQAMEPFFTTKEFGRGSGLGLSQVYGFASASGGAVTIRSAPAQGATIEIWLPRARAAMIAQPMAGLHAPLRLATEGETVLVVEDEPSVLDAVVESLKDLGYRAIPTQDAAAALARLGGDERIDILFSDIVMPGGMNGVKLAVEAARVRPGLRILLSSGYPDEALRDTHGVPHDLAILPKPYRQDELSERLKVARAANASGSGAVRASAEIVPMAAAAGDRTRFGRALRQP